MPAKRKIPSYRLHKASNRGVVTLGGRDYFLGRYGTPEGRQRYDRLIAEWLAHGRQVPMTSAPADFTILELIARFWAHAETHYRRPDGSEGSELDNLRQALRPLKALYGPTTAADFGPRSLRAVRQKMIESGWCRTAINRNIARIKHVFKWGVSQELIPSSVHQALTSVSGLRRGKSDAQESKPVKPVPQSQIDAVLPRVSPQVAAMIRLQLLTGMRPGEVVIMRGTDIDTSGKVWVYRPAFHKTEHHGHAREVRLGPKAQTIIQPFLRADVRGYLFSPRGAEAHRYAQAHVHRRPNQKSNAPRTDRTLGVCYDVTSYRRAIARACEKAFGMPAELLHGPDDETGEQMKALAAARKAWRAQHAWHPHRLRHNAATDLRRQYGIEVARIVLGHRSAAITEVYAEADGAKAAAVMAEVG